MKWKLYVAAAIGNIENYYKVYIIFCVCDIIFQKGVVVSG